MSTTITPPPAGLPPYGPPPPAQPAASGPPSHEPRQPRSSSKVIAILTISLGAAIVLGTIVSATVSTVAAAAVRTETRTIDVSGVTDLDVEVSAATLRVRFADVSEATLEVTSGLGADAWTLERDEEELTVVSPDRFGFSWLFASETVATLTLPQELEGPALDASLGLSAGDLTVEGEFGELDVEVDAGSLDVTGSATQLSAQVNAGGADLDVQGASEADLTLNAGTLDARLTGSPPRLVTVEVSAGTVDLTLPDGTYDVRSDVSAGEFDNGLRTEVGARNAVDVSVSAGTVTIAGAR